MLPWDLRIARKALETHHTPRAAHYMMRTKQYFSTKGNKANKLLAAKLKKQSKRNRIDTLQDERGRYISSEEGKFHVVERFFRE